MSRIIATPRLRRRACCRHGKSSCHQLRYGRFAPSQSTALVGSRARDATELAQERVTTLRSKQPGHGRLLFGVRLVKVLEHSDCKHAVDEVLSAAPCSHASRVGIPCSSVQHLFREDRRATADDFRIRFGGHAMGVGFRKAAGDPRSGTQTIRNSRARGGRLNQSAWFATRPPSAQARPRSGNAAWSTAAGQALSMASGLLFVGRTPTASPSGLLGLGLDATPHVPPLANRGLCQCSDMSPAPLEACVGP